MFNIIRSYKKITFVVALMLIFILSLQAPWQYFFGEQQLKLSVSVKIQHNDILQLFYITDKNGEFNENDSIKVNVNGSDNFQTVKFTLPNRDIKIVRIDTGTSTGPFSIKEIKLKNYKKQYVWDAKSVSNEFNSSNDIGPIRVQDDILYFNSIGSDPYFTSNDINGIYNNVKSEQGIFVYLIINLLLILISCLYIFISLYKRMYAFLKDIIQARILIFELAKKDLQTRYLGSYLGVIWAFIQPTVTILIFWFVFQVGFKSAPVEDVPFVLWLMCGIIPWFFFSESFQSGTNSVIDNSYLVKKVVFRVSVLPIVRILSALFIHTFFIIVIFVMFFIYGYTPNIYNLQVLYYLFATIMIVLGLSWITSSLVVFLRDMGQIISIIIQFGFWLTPIFWSFKIMPEKYSFLFKINPVYYIVEGYRDTFINHIWFWQHYNLTISFWLITFGIFFAGILLFKRLRPHFADVL